MAKTEKRHENGVIVSKKPTVIECNQSMLATLQHIYQRHFRLHTASWKQKSTLY